MLKIILIIINSFLIRKHIFLDIRDESVWGKCGKDQQGWYGYKEGKDNGGSISTLLSGNGKAKLVSANLTFLSKLLLFLKEQEIQKYLWNSLH